MTEVCASSTIFVKEVKFSWKISDFSPMLNPNTGDMRVFGREDYCCTYNFIRTLVSPEFKNGNDKFLLHIKEKSVKSDLTVNGAQVNPDDYHVVVIEVMSEKANVLTGGSLTIDMGGEKFSGMMGHSNHKTVEINPIFKNQTSEIKFPDSGSSKSYFCISRLVTQIKMKGSIYFRSPVTETVGHEPVTDTSIAKLIADMRSLLNRSAECSDFSIECGGKTFPCHEFVLRARSNVLDVMFQNEMTETSRRNMSVVDVGPNTMAGVLEYMYTGGITVNVDNMSELLYIADKYEMEDLLEICFQKLPEIGDDMLGDILFIADKHNFAEFKKEIMLRIIMNKSKFMENQDFVEKLQKVPHLLMEMFKL